MKGDLFVIPLPSYTRPPLSLNQRHHWAQRRTIANQLAADVKNMLTANRAPRGLTKVGIHLNWLPIQQRNRDSDNAFATIKVIQDACVAWGVISGDTHQQVSSSVQIHDAGPPRVFTLASGVPVPARVWFVLKDLSPSPSGLLLGDRPTPPRDAA